MVKIDLGPNNNGFKKSACILYGSYTFKMPMGLLVKSLSIDTIFINSVDVFNLDKT